MLAKAGTGTPPVGSGWLHELKWDGVRCLLTRSRTDVFLRSRTGKDITAAYPELAAAANALEAQLIVDGEIVALDNDGVPSFERLQRRMNLQDPHLVAEAAAAVPITYVVFDLLFSGEPRIEVPLEERRAMLEQVGLAPGMVLSEAYADSAAPWKFAAERGLEGLVSKRAASPYRPGARSPDWVKSILVRSVRAVVGGFTPGEGGRAGRFGALVLGMWDGGRLRWIGSVGSGFSDEAVRHIAEALGQMTTAESPFDAAGEIPRGVVWVHPALVAVVQYRQWTAAGRLRAPVFKGFSDHPSDGVTWDSEGPGNPGG